MSFFDGVGDVREYESNLSLFSLLMESTFSH